MRPVLAAACLLGAALFMYADYGGTPWPGAGALALLSIAAAGWIMHRHFTMA